MKFKFLIALFFLSQTNVIYAEVKTKFLLINKSNRDLLIFLNNGEITTDMKTYEILKDKKIMEENRLELPYGFALHHLEE